MLSVVAALALLTWVNGRRVRHVETVTSVGRQSDTLAGDAVPRNALIVPEHVPQSYHWLLQTDQMFDRHELRVRHIGYENAPFGRDVAAASPYRWWLGSFARLERALHGGSIHQAIERAAVIGEPVLHGVLLIITATFVAWRFGSAAGALVALAMALLFPFATQFLPAAPDDAGLASVVGLWAVLLLGPGLIRRRGSGGASATLDPAGRRWFALAGVMGGIGLWLSPAHTIPILIGIAAGAWIAAWLRRTPPGVPPAAPLPWRIWAVAGGLSTLAAYLIEYFPGHLGGWQLRSVHPLYGVAWLGLGEILAQTSAWIETRKVGNRWRAGIWLAVALAAVAALPFVMWRHHDPGFLATELWDFRLTKLPDAPVAPSFAAWLVQSGDSFPLFSTVVPFLVLAPAIVTLIRRKTPDAVRLFIALGLGAVAGAAALGFRQIAWWSEAQALLLVPAIGVAVAIGSPGWRWSWTGLVAFLALPGLFAAIPKASLSADAPTQPEVLALIERDMARWLAQHTAAAHAVFIAPPDETIALSYYGAGDGIATLSWQNKNGLEAAVRILSASTPEEAKALIEKRHVTHLIMPTWDPYLDVYARMGMGQLDGTFMNRLHLWKLPPWLRPVPYVLPVIPGFENQAVTVLQVVEDQSDPIALSRTAEYFLELGRLAEAAAIGQQLRRYPADMNAWIARAEVEMATGDNDSLAKSMAILLPYVKARRDHTLPWDSRVGLAVLLARTKHTDEAKQQIQKCVAQANAARLRGLPTGALYRLLVLSRVYQVPFAEAPLQALALSLLPDEARKRVQGP